MLYSQPQDTHSKRLTPFFLASLPQQAKGQIMDSVSLICDSSVYDLYNIHLVGIDKLYMAHNQYSNASQHYR